MYSNKKILAIIPARANSKRLPNKNTILLKGKPLIEYTIDIALNCKYIDDIIITSNDSKVEEIAKRRKIKFRKRPNCISRDISTTQECVDDIFKTYGKLWDVTVLLQPTTLFRNVEDINKCIELYVSGKFESVLSVEKVTNLVFHVNGSIYVFNDKIFTENVGLVSLPKKESIDIDTELDFKIVEMIMNENNC